MKRTRKISRGMMLIELIGYLLVMAAVAALITEMVATSIKVSREETARDVMLQRVDSAITSMRRDVWRSVAISGNADRLILVQPDGVVFWEVESGGKLSRYTAPELPKKTTYIQMPKLTFVPQEKSLRVTVESGPPGAAKREQITLVSQILMAGGEP